MTTSTSVLRTAVGAALAALFVVLITPTPAFAAPVAIGVGPISVKETAVTTEVKVRNTAHRAGGVKVSAAAAGEAAGLVDVKIANGAGCKAAGSMADCGNMRPRESKSFKVTVTPKPNSGLKEGDSKAGNITFTVAAPNSGTKAAPLTVEGFTSVAPAVKGTITDIDDKSTVAGVKVSAKEKGGGKLGSTVTTNDKGEYRIVTEIDPDVEVEVTATKDGFEKASNSSVTGSEELVVDLRMKKAESSKSEPAEKKPNDAGDKKKDDEGGFNFTTWILVLLGALLVIGGSIAIWLLMRKKVDDDDDDNDGNDGNNHYEPPTHQSSASQTGRLGIYEASGPRPGMDNPTMIHQGPLYRDDDLARYGSEPASSAFGPSYGDRRTQQVDPGREEPAPTAMYPSAAPEPRSGATSIYPSQADSGYSDPRSGGPAYPEPHSGSPAYSSQPYSGGPAYPSQPGSGYPAEPQSGAYSDPRSAPPAYPAEPQSGAYSDPRSAPPAYPAEPQSGAYSDPRSAGGGQYREAWGSSYDDPPPPRSSGRHYRDDDYDDRPRSW